jgi:hypothetical protein
MSVVKFENFLEDDLYEEAVKTADNLLTLGSNVFSTNRWWDIGIRKDSFPVFVHGVNRESELHAKLKKTIETKTQKILVDNNIMIYYWTRYSYIPWHNDNRLYDGAISIYLNRRWHQDWGGYFLYEDGEEIKAVLPQPNLALVQYDSVSHCTTPVNFEGDLRISIQAFLITDKDKKE